MLSPPYPWQLRPLQLDDLDDVLVIDRLSLPTPTKAAVYRYELAQNKLAHYQALAVVGNGRMPTLIGFAGYWRMGDEIHVSMIAVHPDWRGRGLGELLLLNQLFDAAAMNADQVTLEVRASNKVAQALYAKYAFVEVGRRPRYYKDTGEAAVLMTLDLHSTAAFHQTLSQWRETLYTRLAGADFPA